MKLIYQKLKVKNIKNSDIDKLLKKYYDDN